MWQHGGRLFETDHYDSGSAAGECQQFHDLSGDGRRVARVEVGHSRSAGDNREVASGVERRTVSDGMDISSSSPLGTQGGLDRR